MMKKSVLGTFIFASLMLGCSQREQGIEQEHARTEVKTSPDAQLQNWVGHYQGALPCAGCTALCEGCNGMKVDLRLHADQTFLLERTSYSDPQQHERYEGHFSFLDDGKLKIQLHNVKDRNQLILGEDYVEILNAKTGLAYQAFEDFELDKIA